MTQPRSAEGQGANDARPVRQARPGALARKEAMWGYLFVSAPLLGFLIFGLIPIVMSLGLAFMKWDMFRAPRFAGIDNFARVASDPIVLLSFQNTLVFFLGVPIGMALSLLLALAMNQRIRGIGLFRTIYFLPVVSSVVAVSVLWRWIFNPDFGLMNVLLRYIGIDGPLWLGSAQWAKPALIIMGVWGGLGFNMLLYLAALQGVPRELLEAAKIDGASAWQRFRFITWPFLTPTTFFILVTSIIGTFQVFAQIHLMTRPQGPTSIGGGPRWATLTIVYYLWLNGFQYYDMGYAASLAWIMGALMMVLTIVQFRVSRRWVFYE